MAPPPVAPAGPADPHQLGLAAARLGSSAKRQARTALAVASALLEDGEVVEALVQGQFEGEPGVAVLTGRRVLLVNEAQWKVGTASIAIDPALTVQGWQDDKVASLIFQSGDRSGDPQVTIDSISDRPLAQEMAGRVRAKVAEAG